MIHFRVAEAAPVFNDIIGVVVDGDTSPDSALIWASGGWHHEAGRQQVQVLGSRGEQGAEHRHAGLADVLQYLQLILPHTITQALLVAGVELALNRYDGSFRFGWRTTHCLVLPACQVHGGGR